MDRVNGFEKDLHTLIESVTIMSRRGMDEPRQNLEELRMSREKLRCGRKGQSLRLQRRKIVQVSRECCSAID